MNWDTVDFNDLDRRISEAKRGGFPPEPRWRREGHHEGQPIKTVNDVPEAKGNFTW